MYLRLDPARPDPRAGGLGPERARRGAHWSASGPTLLSATVIGPRPSTAPAPSASTPPSSSTAWSTPRPRPRHASYEIPRNGVLGAKRQLSGRLVFLSLEQPEGPHVPTTLSVLGGLTDLRGNEGPAGSDRPGSRLEDPGAVVSGRVFTADGTPVTSGIITYAEQHRHQLQVPRSERALGPGARRRRALRAALRPPGQLRPALLDPDHRPRHRGPPRGLRPRAGGRRGHRAGPGLVRPRRGEGHRPRRAGPARSPARASSW